MIGFLHDLVNEIDLLFAIGPIEYVKDKVSDIGWTIDHALGLDEEDEEDEGSVTEVVDLNEEAGKFINDHMSEIREVIIKTIKGVSPSVYPDQQSYLKDAFDKAADACWAYIQDIFNDPAITPELSSMITETMIKDTAVIVAMTMFIEWALREDSENNDEAACSEEVEECESL